MNKSPEKSKDKVSSENQVEALLENIDKDLLLKLLDALVVEQENE